MNKSSVLIIDDDETIVSILETILTQHNYTVITANNGKEGLDIVKTMPPNAIILDRQMPEMDGDAVLKHLKSDEKTKHIPIMMLTSMNEITNVSECLEMGAKDYIVKPFDHHNLIIRLRNILR